jgi:hypothetical protein
MVEMLEKELEEDIPESGLEVLLTGLEVDSKGNLVARFRNYGAVYFPDWDHWFVTRMLGRNRDRGKAAEKRDGKYAKVVKAVAEKEKLKEFEKKKKDKYWWTYCVKCPISLKDELPDEFIRGHYTQQARWRLGSPCNFVTMDRPVAYALRRERQIEKQLEYFRGAVSEYKKGNNLTIAVNDINEIFEDYTGNNWNEIRTRIKAKKNLASLDEEVLLARKGVADQIAISNQRLEGKAKISYVRRSKNSREYTLRTEQRIDRTDPEWKKKEKPWNYIHKTKRTPSASELLGKKWMFVDIEIPYFRRDKPEITWVGVSYIENGAEKKVIHTVHDIGSEEVNGFKIVRHKNETELIENLTEEVKRENPDFVSAYNARFDLVKLRESEAGFSVGDEDSDPLFKVTTRFFERMGIKDRIVIDPLRWAKIARSYDINAKLEMTAGFEKEISYDDMEKLEEKSLGGEKEAGLTIARYLSQDIAHLKGIVFSDEFRNSLGDTLILSKIFSIGIERLLHSANCINDVQEKGYFSALGIYREEVPPHLRTKKMQQKKTAAREAFKKYSIQKPLEELAEGKEGFFEGVYKVYVPYGDFFRDALAVRFPEVRRFFDFKDSRREDKQRLFFLEQYGKEFSRWISEDYGFFIKELRSLDKISKNVDMGEFEIAYKAFKAHLVKDSEWGAKHFDEGDLSPQAIEKHATPELREFLEKNKLNFEQFAELSNQRISVKRRWKNVIGNYSVAPSLRFSDEERSYSGTLVIEDIIAKRIRGIKDFISNEGFEVVGQEGSSLYVRGNKERLLEGDAPVVLVDEIPKLYVADNAYYKKFGFYSHLKLKEEPDYHSTMFEMRTFREILDRIMEGKNSEAIQVYERELERISSGKITNLEIVFYNKNKERYSAFTPNSTRKDGRVYFMTKAPEKDVKEDEKGKYVEDQERGECVRIDITGIDAITPDYDKYIKRFSKRGEAILAPIRKYEAQKTKQDNRQLELELK